MTERSDVDRLKSYISRLAPTGDEAEETLHAIVLGAADALVIDTLGGPRVYALEDANEPYRRLIERMSEAAIILHPDGVVIYCNGRLAQALARESLVGENLSSIVAEDQRDLVQELLARGARRNATAELLFVAADGAAKAYRASATPLVLNQQSCVALVLTAHEEIEALKISQAVLRKSEERFRALFQYAATAIAMSDGQGRIAEANPAYCRLLGYTQEELRQLAFADLVHPEDRDANLAELRRLHNGEVASFAIENRYIRKDGETVWVQKFVSRLRDDKGEPADTVVLVTDVTERRRLEQELRDASRRKDEFLATLAHELRNPLAPISNALQVLEREDAVSANALRLCAMMSRQVAHLVRLVDDLLEVARITTGKIELRKQAVNVGDTIRQALETCAPLLESGRHALSLSLGDGPLFVKADPVRLAQVFSNLLNNAAKYTPNGGRIEVELRREGGEAVVTMRDNGMGIKPEILPHVFDLFTQSKRSAGHSQGGIGVGLALARSLVQMHGGEIKGYSAGEGLGSKFVVRLGLCAAPSEPSGAAAGEDARTSGGLRRVLVVDDDRDVADSFVSLLQCLGIEEIRAAYDGGAAVAAVAEFEPQLVFLDIGMPGVDGFEAARRIRALPQGKNTCIVALSGWGQSDDRRRSLEAGFDRHFVKPIAIDDLEELLKSLP